MNTTGKGILKVVSILFIVFGAIATIVSIVGLIGSAWLTTATAGFAGLGGLLIVGTVIALIGSVLELIIGILGVKKCEDPSQNNFFIVTGIVLCALNLISIIMAFSVTGLIAFVLPILYIVGGYMNKNAA